MSSLSRASTHRKPRRSCAQTKNATMPVTATLQGHRSRPRGASSPRRSKSAPAYRLSRRRSVAPCRSCDDANPKSSRRPNSPRPRLRAAEPPSFVHSRESARRMVPHAHADHARARLPVPAEVRGIRSRESRSAVRGVSPRELFENLAAKPVQVGASRSRPPLPTGAASQMLCLRRDSHQPSSRSLLQKGHAAPMPGCLKRPIFGRELSSSLRHDLNCAIRRLPANEDRTAPSPSRRVPLQTGPPARQAPVFVHNRLHARASSPSNSSTKATNPLAPISFTLLPLRRAHRGGPPAPTLVVKRRD